MVHIILFILKLIGIILASILGILIFLILVVLLVPIRYHINAMKKEEILAEVKVSWLFHLIYFHGHYIDNHLVMRLKIFGKKFYDSEHPKELKKKAVKPVKKAKNKINDVADDLGLKTDSVIVKDKKIKDKKVKDKKLIEKKVIENKVNEKTVLENKVIEKKANERINNGVKKEINIDTNKNPVSDTKSVTENKSEMIKVDEKNIKKEEKIPIMEPMLPELDTSNSNDSPKTGKIHSFINKLKDIRGKIKDFFQKVKNFGQGIKSTIEKIKNNLLRIKEIWNDLKTFIKNEINKAGLKHILLSLKKIFKHICPTKLRIAVEFGTDDPCSTGQAIGVLAILYGYYGESIQVIPNFETEILEGTLFCKGRIRLFTLLIICIKLILDKNFRQLIKNFKAFKEEL